MYIRESLIGYTLELTDREADALLSDLAYLKEADDVAWAPLPLEQETEKLLAKLTKVQEEVERGRFGCE